MKRKFLRLIAATMALCLCVVTTPIAALAATDTSTFQTIAYSDVSTLAVGQRVVITGTPNYSASTSNASSNFFGVDTAEGVWYIAIGKTSVAAFKAALPAQSIIFYGMYSGTLDAIGMPILDIQSGAVSVSGTLQESLKYLKPGRRRSMKKQRQRRKLPLQPPKLKLHPKRSSRQRRRHLKVRPKAQWST